MAPLEVHTPPLSTRRFRTPFRNKSHMLGFKQFALSLRSSEGKTRCQGTIPKHHAMTGNHPGFRIHMQSISDDSRITRIPRQSRDLSVGRYCSFRNPAHNLIHTLGKIEFCHSTIFNVALDRCATVIRQGDAPDADKKC